ncbi:hypothetical protein KW803_00670 [Candidatus Saccharibacteria bacterium]|nr:hypothetical protein [Candidatus Saccharibacteria bacterium]
MDIDNASEILLIVVSTTLSIFLIVGIIALIYIVKILKQVRRITDKAENVADSVEAAATTFEKAASPLAIVKIIGGIVDQATKTRKRKD